MARPATPLSPALIRVIDVGGLLVSSLCAVHCALTPVLLVALPFVGWQHWEMPLRLAAVLIGIGAVGLGALFHRNFSVVWTLLFGIVLLGVASLLHGQLIPELLVSVAASAALIRAHWLNTKACANSGHDCPPARVANSFGPGSRKNPHHHP
ncbi:MAG TPA: MerC domain-containing protein [Polyangiaceae bacterium]|nr:MerC domain-containing protein [Polyangiaceae bacterium]